jgi:hypothetical protein
MQKNRDSPQFGYEYQNSLIAATYVIRLAVTVGLPIHQTSLCVDLLDIYEGVG